MASDANLIKGAWAAAGGNIEDKGLDAAKGMTAIGDSIAGKVAPIIQERHKAFKDFAEWELTRVPGMNDAEFDSKHNELMDMKKQYMWGDNLSRSKVMRHMSEMKTQQEEIDQAKKDFAAAAKDKMNKNNEFIESDLAQNLVKAMSGETTFMDGREGWMVNDGLNEKFYDAAGIQDLIQRESFDEGSSNVLNQFVSDISEQSRQTDPELLTEFDWDANFRKIKGSFVGKGTSRSLAKDEIIPGRNFYDDFQKFLTEGSYAELGITEEMAINMDPTPDDGITPEDAKLIADEVVARDDLRDHYLAVYYNKYLEQNWNGVQNKKSIRPEVGPEQERLKGRITKDPLSGRLMWSR